MLIITDAHVSEANGNVVRFFAMLKALEQGREDLVFLGDIFDLWISLPRYEEPIQHRFSEWCREAARNRRIGFVEGNHEFYVVQHHRDSFTWSSDWGRREGDTLFVHGDLINRDDHNYLRWRKLTKNALTQCLVRLLPGGPGLAMKLKQKMKKTNKAFRLHLPVQALDEYAIKCYAQGIRNVFVGHFHERYDHAGPSGSGLHVLPDWFSSETITRFQPHQNLLRSTHWQTLLSNE